VEGKDAGEMSMDGGDALDENVLEIHISVEMERQAAEAVQLEARRLLEREGLRIKAVTVTRAVTVSTEGDDFASASAEGL
jgi:hypothetical protein